MLDVPKEKIQRPDETFKNIEIWPLNLKKESVGKKRRERRKKLMLARAASSSPSL